MERAVSRHQLLLLELDNQLLLWKELELEQQDLAHRLEELLEAQRYRRQGLLPPVPPQELTQREQLDQLLWGANPPE